MAAPTIPEGLSADEQAGLLRTENELAKQRDAEQREFMLAQEDEREAREKAQRLLVEQQEKMRVAELERLETEAMEVSQEMVDAADPDTEVADMYAALSQGTAPPAEGSSARRVRPE